MLTILTLAVLALPVVALLCYLTGKYDGRQEMAKEVSRYRRCELAAYRKLVACHIARKSVGVEEIEIASN